MRNTRQLKFKSISEYYKELSFLTNEIGRCKKWSQIEKNILFETKFLENLTTETRIRMSEMEKEISKDIVNYISKVEETIHNDRRYNNHKNISNAYEGKNNIKTEDRNKYCSFHKTKTHNTNECFAKKV